MLENLLRFEDGRTVTIADIRAVVGWSGKHHSDQTIAYRPTRVLMQDFTGVPAIVDLAALREAMAAVGGDPRRINPLSPVDLVIDHSVMVDHFGTAGAAEKNMALEFQRNGERYALLRWGQATFNNFRVVPPGAGICHQVNLEYLAQGVWVDQYADGTRVAYPDSVVGTDSHTTMINGLGVLGWGVGGIEAEAAMLGQPVAMLLPEVVGVRVFGHLREGVTATDVVLTVTETLRRKGVVGKFVEFYGEGLAALTIADRATIANMAPEYGATCGFFPIDRETIAYLSFTGRDPHRVRLVEAYARKQGMWREADGWEPEFTDTVALDLTTVEPSLAGPRRPQDRVALSVVKQAFLEALPGFAAETDPAKKVEVSGTSHSIGCGDVMIAAITSCTNTSNPSVMIAAGLLAKKAVEKGLATRPWVKTSLAPGSQVVTDYLAAAGLQSSLDRLGFNVVGYGCTTCIGNAGPLAEPLVQAIETGQLVTAAVLSGNRNFEGRVSPHTRANYLASPPLVVAYALAGSMTVDLTCEPLGVGTDGNPVFLRDIWPSAEEIRATLAQALTPEMFRARYADVFTGTEAWQKGVTASGETYAWDLASTYVKAPPYFPPYIRSGAAEDLVDIQGARCLALVGDSVTTDHISPAGSIRENSPAGLYLRERGVAVTDFNSYGARRGNHEVMMRGTFANIRIRNEMTPGIEGGVTRHVPSGAIMPIYDAAMRYREEGVPLVVIAGTEYGTGSSRDWAAKGPALLGVRVVIAESFERIHRSNLIGMGILPLQFKEGEGRKTLRLDGSERFDMTGLATMKRSGDVTVMVHRADGTSVPFVAQSRIETLYERDYYRHGDILHYILSRLIGE
ncbi:MAG: aconitate hydratase 1 [Rhodospirillaceae bacterium]|nr:MAG: aconitate hydratase 1 [Rhodospirillaceae bacterium]